MSIHRPRLRAVLALGLLASLMATAEPGKTPEKPAAEGKSPLDITAESVEMDFNNRKGTLVGNVKVSDERMLLLADKMVVHLADQNKVRMIEAIGNVVISQVGTQRKARAGKAVFDVETDMVVLTDGPTLEDAGTWTAQKAEKMVYDRIKGTFKMSGMGGVKITGQVGEGQGGAAKDLFGPGKEKKKEEKEEKKP